MDRLECAPVPTDLVVRYDRTPRSDLLDLEADHFMVDPRRIEPHPEGLVLHLASLNQAYTRASLRFERRRSAHGGSVYTNLSWIDRTGQLTLDQIRIEVEEGRWKFPSPMRPGPPLPTPGIPGLLSEL
jgi:hypothetical protein